MADSSIRDYTECPDDNTCKADRGPYGMTYKHEHCASDGCVLMAVGGGGDDGRGVDGYETDKGSALPCFDCKALVAQECARKAGDTIYCLPCYIEASDREQAKDESALLIWSATENLKALTARLSDEPDANIASLFDHALELDAVHDHLLDLLAARMHAIKVAA